MKKCKVCGALTDTVFNINLKATPICEECARRIFLQQATWYSQQEFKNLALPQVSESEDVEREDSVCQYKNVCKNDFVNDKCLADTEAECDCLILAK